MYSVSFPVRKGMLKGISSVTGGLARREGYSPAPINGEMVSLSVIKVR
jgi:hypothetical protein